MRVLLRNRCLVLVGLTALWANCAVIIGDSPAQQLKQPPKKPDNQKKGDQGPQKAIQDAWKASQADAIKEAYILLAAAEFDYGGHKGKASDAAKAAANALNPRVFKDWPVEHRIKDLKDKNAGLAKAMNWEGRKLYDKHQFTDYQLFQAQAILSDIHKNLPPNKGEWKHVHAALQSIDTALTVEAPKRTKKLFEGKHSEALVEAFILLSASEFKYEGHRMKAVGHIQRAATNLGPNALKAMNAPQVQQNINALRENNKALAMTWAGPKGRAVVERYLSDAQLYEAGVITGFFTWPSKSAADVQNAINEIGLALRIR
jgi:hypothetical protein